MDLGNAANSFFLLRIPRIKEILSKKIHNFNQSDINPDTISFHDKNQAKQFSIKREENLNFIKSLYFRMQEKKEFPTLQTLAVEVVAKNYHLYP